jgi:hypothetical protein
MQFECKFSQGLELAYPEDQHVGPSLRQAIFPLTTPDAKWRNRDWAAMGLSRCADPQSFRLGRFPARPSSVGRGNLVSIQALGALMIVAEPTDVRRLARPQFGTYGVEARIEPESEGLRWARPDLNRRPTPFAPACMRLRLSKGPTAVRRGDRRCPNQDVRCESALISLPRRLALEIGNCYSKVVFKHWRPLKASSLRRLT